MALPQGSMRDNKAKASATPMLIAAHFIWHPGEGVERGAHVLPGDSTLWR
jgi:hypothetical protein